MNEIIPIITILTDTTYKSYKNWYILCSHHYAYVSNYASLNLTSTPWVDIISPILLVNKTNRETRHLALNCTNTALRKQVLTLCTSGSKNQADFNMQTVKSFRFYVLESHTMRKGLFSFHRNAIIEPGFEPGSADDGCTALSTSPTVYLHIYFSFKTQLYKTSFY